MIHILKKTFGSSLSAKEILFNPQPARMVLSN